MIPFIDTTMMIPGHHDDVIKWKHFPRHWPFVWRIHRPPVNSPHKVQWRGALMFSLICAWTNGWVKNRNAGDLRRNRAHYDVIVMIQVFFVSLILSEGIPSQRAIHEEADDAFVVVSRHMRVCYCKLNISTKELVLSYFNVMWCL